MSEAASKKPVSRRSFMVCASAFGLASLNASIGNAGTETLKPIIWKGAALGAEGTIKLYHPDYNKAATALKECQKEILRLEKLFSLYREDSQVVALNKAGYIENPDIDFVTLLSMAKAFSDKTDGLFDVSVQPLWRFYAEYFADGSGRNEPPSQERIDQALKHVGYSNIDVTSRKIQFAKPGMAVTFNGIAQGFITDRVKTFLQNAGFENVLISLGEIYALGPRGDGLPWRIGLEGDLDEANEQRAIPLVDQALATSGGYASPFSNNSTANHLLNPITGGWSSLDGSISVLSETATHADMISTVLTLMSKSQRASFLNKLDHVNAVFFSNSKDPDWHKSI